MNGRTGDYLLPEITGGAVALLDFDRDGDLDVYLGQGGSIPHGPDAMLKTVSCEDREPSDRLFRNDSNLVTGELRFTDVTAAVGLEACGYSMGVAVGDVDRDGWPDLYLTGYGSNQLWINERGARFVDQTTAAGVDDPRWSVAAAFVDVTGDGWLDLYVANYLDFDGTSNPLCRSASSRRTYCGPQNWKGVDDRLFVNRGDGTFVDESSLLGRVPQPGKGLGVVDGDLNEDGFVDLYVANDQMQNFLWTGSRTGRFENQALELGCAVNSDGFAEASMGVVLGDIDNDGDEDLFMTHIQHESNTLFLNQGGSFLDSTSGWRLAGPSLDLTAWGTAMVDVDNNGWMDLVVANGSVTVLEHLIALGDPFPLGEPNQVFLNRGDGVLEPLPPDRIGGAFDRAEVSRGLAVGDIDNDGDLDVVVNNNNGPVRVAVNQVGSKAHWLGIQLVDAQGQENVLGAVVTVTDEDGRRFFRRTRTCGGFAAAHDPRILVGLGDGVGPVTVEVEWPDGRVDAWSDIPVRRYVELRQRSAGSGIAASPATEGSSGDSHQHQARDGEAEERGEDGATDLPAAE